MRLLFVTTLLLSAAVSFGQSSPSIVPDSRALKAEGDVSYVVTRDGDDAAAVTIHDFVTLDYTGWNEAGEIVDATSKHPAVRTFAMAKLFPGLQQAILGMKKGEERRVWIPADLSPKKIALVFDVAVREILQPLTTPSDVAAVPVDAERSSSGLAWKILTPGDGSTKPKRNSWVTVHYSGWTTKGELFDSSYKRGEPSAFALNQVIGGWTEGLQMMTPGERRRFWIPAKLAYRGRSGPQGMLVFDIELIRFR
jgi:FKBP-type peptidyl-prolyl cis-trans isomerase